MGEGPMDRVKRIKKPAYTFKACPNIGTIKCIHSDGSRCTDLFRHLCLTFGDKVPEYLDTYNNMRDYFQVELKRRIGLLERRIGELESELEDQDKLSTGFKPAPGHKRKMADEELSQMDVDMVPPAKRTNQTQSQYTVPASKVIDIVSHIRFDVVNAEARFTSVDLVLVVEHALFRAPSTLQTNHHLSWDLRLGRLIPTLEAKSHARNGMFPGLIPFIGQPAGAQVFPAMTQEFSQLVSDAQTPGSVIPVFKLCLM
ncbi:hypothetical protein PQX77_016773 [Marasmius sp. AFHP31]|nr:hypothetical protein PQX77_016773 [Marasmius sp. AFHP31]